MNETQFVSRNKLRGAMAEYGIKTTELAEKLNITKQTLYNKMKKNFSFTENEIAILKELFGLGIFHL